MIKANELRIGNYINTPDCTEWITTELDITAVCTHQLNARPIPLTEEWLTKFGFLKDNNFTWEGVGMHIKQYEDGFYVWLGADLLLNHVHQLQNLYFCLTGEELKLNETIKA